MSSVSAAVSCYCSDFYSYTFYLFQLDAMVLGRVTFSMVNSVVLDVGFANHCF